MNHNQLLMSRFDDVETEGKGKAIPIQIWTGLEGFRRLRHPDFKTIGI
jgi:hypothetical protein